MKAGCTILACKADTTHALCPEHLAQWLKSGEAARATEQEAGKNPANAAYRAFNDWVRRIVAETQNAGNGDG